MLGLVCAFTLNLNRVAVLLGIYSNLPWILPAYYTLATDGRGPDHWERRFRRVCRRDLTQRAERSVVGGLPALAHTLTPLAKAFALGSTLGAIILALDRLPRRA